MPVLLHFLLFITHCAASHPIGSLGVSRQLVTFALGDYSQVSSKSRERILAAALEMGYRPNPHARALLQKRTEIIALWIPDQISTHYTHVARELGRLAKRAKYELVISEVGAADAGQIGSNVPEEIALIGCDSIEDTEYLE